MGADIVVELEAVDVLPDELIDVLDPERVDVDLELVDHTAPSKRRRVARAAAAARAAADAPPPHSRRLRDGATGRDLAWYVDADQIRALAALGLDNVPNQEQITSLLVGLLGSGTVEARSRAAASLWQLVREQVL